MLMKCRFRSMKVKACHLLREGHVVCQSKKAMQGKLSKQIDIQALLSLKFLCQGMVLQLGLKVGLLLCFLV